MTVRFLLPARERLPSLTEDVDVARWLARADRLPAGEAGERAQLQRQFRVSPTGWPLAALTREMDAGDASESLWLRADPAHVQADMTAVRLLACGAVGLDREQADALLAAIKPLFDVPGWELSAPTPERWYLRLPAESALPEFVDPERALGDEIHDLLPSGAIGRRWRALLNETQIVLHNHPLNAERVRNGRLAVNSVWFFGAGQLPSQVVGSATFVASGDAELRALALAAGAVLQDAPLSHAALNAAADLVDLRHYRDTGRLTRDWLLPLRQALRARRIARAELDFADGGRWVLTPKQRWRIWRRAPVVPA